MLQEHLGYVAGRVRLEQFQAAIAKTINAGDRVADLGCGSDLLLTLGGRRFRSTGFLRRLFLLRVNSASIRVRVTRERNSRRHPLKRGGYACY